MALSFTEKKRIRKSFGRIPEAIELPNLIEVQRASYENFLQMNTPAHERTADGLGGVFRSVFPITDFSERAVLEYVSYEFEPPKFDTEECMQRDLTYAAPLKIRLQLVVFDVDEETGAKSVKEVKEQEVYLGDIPLMTEKGTFIVNGTERVIVSQMHRSPGVFFDHDKGKTHSSGKLLFAARIIPYRGSWLDFEFDAKDILNCRIDRKRKLPATTLLMALGYDVDTILDEFYSHSIYRLDKKGWITGFRPDAWKGGKPDYELVDAKSGDVIAEAGKKITALKARRIVEGGTDEILVPSTALEGKFLARDVVNMETGEIYGEAGDEITEESLAEMRDAGVKALEILDIDQAGRGPWLRNTLKADKNETRFEALSDIYRVMRPGEPPTQEAAEALFNQLFFDSERYDLSAVGRVKMNVRLKVAIDGFDEAEDDVRILRKDDIVGVMKVILDLKDGTGEVDDIDNLGNRRVRSVGELMENNYRIGLVRMERAIKERMSSVDIDTVMPHDLINAKPVVASVREFFGSSQLSQFMDQTNPLSEITHKRRLSALGPGGLTRERAGFEVRDVHPTHYGRICPIETPEGPNIGLINSLATHARINKYGFIESPYRKVEDGKLSAEVVYLSAVEEARYNIAQANAGVDGTGVLENDFVNCRAGAGRDAMLVPREEVDYIDVSPKQLVSVAAALIPYLENDDANRALMGSNMQRQAVPLVRSEAPLVGTGMEAIVARDSRAAVVAKRSGVVEQVDATRIVVRATEDLEGSRSGVDIYRLAKFRRSNQNSCINQRPIVKVGDQVTKLDIIADGPSTDLGELALGRNVLVAFMPWNGYNFEDSILISERIVKDDVFTSIHLEEFEIAARDTKLGPEEITRDIPNVGEEALRNLDEAGIVAVGAEVKAGDILVGKVTPKGESPMTPEEKLLRAIFGEKASDVRDTSLRVPPGDAGTVVEVRVFNRHGIDKDQRALQIEREQIEALQEDKEDEQAILERNTYTRLKDMLVGKDAAAGPKGFKTGKIAVSDLESISESLWWDIQLKSEKAQAELDGLREQFDASIRELEARFNDKVDKVQRGDDLPPGVMKVVKVFLAVKRKLQPGDKMAGRHGNKGVISKINPPEDMPFLEDGTPVDIVLNPLGVPSRMNVGQILETHTGWAAAGLGRIVDEALEQWHHNNDADALRKTLQTVYGKDEDLPETDEEIVELAGNVTHGVPIATPVFDGAREADIVELLERAGFDSSGQVTLYDGRTGESFNRPVTVGYKYLLKLHHLVDEKIHARSTGPYSLVTQQPLGGKAQFGGQRFGEMEVWALEAYGAAYTLQEMLTVKSDDTAGRAKVYEAIVRGDDTFEAGIPESFNVLVKEMRSLGLNVELIEEDKDDNTPVAAE
ncbi:MAG: DNA-directed RNA polymerase subunit beta [Pseudomonadota bacterium]